jgi:putative holliday junction resolvase
VKEEDERFTSVIAQRSLIYSGVKKMKRRDKSLVDMTSAAILLQGYLERIK